MDKQDVERIIELNGSFYDRLGVLLDAYNDTQDEKDKSIIMDKIVLIEDIMEDICVIFEPELGAYARRV